ncbi:MAG TPA: hypothetical protein PL143_09625 [Rhodocyclaceae bacterium]|nr:hypothetical protein [Rhodocyclaceae bacterium]
MRAPEDVSLDDKVAFLATPAAYAEPAARVETVETHMSWVFLTEDHAYKLKKPVRYDFLDFSTIAARRADCAAELVLNRRLAASVYLAAVALTLTDRGELRLGGDGPVADWLVRMRRLPARRMLDAAIAERRVDAADVARFMRVLTDFYRRAEIVATSPSAYREGFERAIRAHCAELCKPGYGLPAAAIARITAVQARFILRHAALLESRAARVVDGHGDLRPEHICLVDEPVVIDCLEFDRALRLLDPADELAYLALECERLGAADVGAQVFEHYAQATGDRAPDALIHFYKSFRACLRAQIAIWHTVDGRVRDHAKWRQRARDYLALADRHAIACDAGGTSAR